MRKYRKLAQLAYAIMVVATIWLLSPAAAEAGYSIQPRPINLDPAQSI